MSNLGRLHQGICHHAIKNYKVHRQAVQITLKISIEAFLNFMFFTVSLRKCYCNTADFCQYFKANVNFFGYPVLLLPSQDNQQKIKMSLISKSRKVILLLYSAHMRPCLECCIRLWSSKHKKDLLKRVVQGPQDERGVEGPSLLSRQAERVGLLRLKTRSLQGNFPAAFQYLREACKKAGEGLWTSACSDGTRGNGLNLKEGRFRLSI